MSLKFNALSENFKKAKDALRKRKEERDRWIDHATLLENKIKAAEEEHGIQILDRSNKTGRATSHLASKAEAARPSPNASFTSEGGLDQTDLELPPLAAESLRQEDEALHAIPAFAMPNSDSTEEGSDVREDDLPQLPAEGQHNATQIKDEPSSDTPVVVSERAVKKRKRDDVGATDVTPSRRVKLEASDDSSPILGQGQQNLDLHESIDLGDVAQRMMTPRKRKEFEDWQRRNESQAEPFNIAPSTSTPLYVRPDPDQGPARAPERTSALTPVSVNRRLVRPVAEKPAVRSARGLVHGISTLAEDGGVYKNATGARQQRGLGTTTPVPKGRLDALLNTPSAPEDGTITRSLQKPQERTNTPGSARTLSNDLNIPGRRELPFEKARRQKENQSTDTGNRSNLNSPRLQPQDTRSPLAHKKGSTSLLRNKAPSELRPDDFKVNPQANEGHDFAFSDVVRDRGERACLPGCTDIHCCGKQFRALALSQKPNPPLTAVQRQEEQKLLEEYLGDFSYKLAGMNKEARDELWLEAKTEELANKYGKHRHRYSRMRSPPGFWNADFPDTQELEAERAEAGKREKQTVQERYREAMKPGGRWIFRDE